MSQKRLTMIVNPRAGRRGFSRALGPALEIFDAAGYRLEVCFTQYSGHGRKLAAEHAAGSDLLVCMGGDGTLSEVVSGLMDVQARPQLGYIPMGSTNDMAATLGMPSGSAACARHILASGGRELDVGRTGDGQYFAYVAAFGAFTDVCYSTPQEAKNKLGHLAYLLEGGAQLANLPHYRCRVEYDGGAQEGDFIFGGLLNTVSMAGMLRFDESLVDLQDGRFELLLVRTPKNAVELSDAVTDLLTRRYRGKEVTLVQTSQARFLFQEPVPFTRDGEDGGTHRELLLSAVPRAIDFRA